MKPRITIPRALALACAIPALLLMNTGCGDDHGHDDHDHAHGDDDHGKGEDDGHGHDHGDGGHDHDGDAHPPQIAGPNGGRVLQELTPRLEFFITEDRKVRITAVTNDEKDPTALPIGEQIVKVITGDRLDPTKLDFAKDGNSLISNGSLPDGLDVPVVVQVKLDEGAKTELVKFQANLRDCPTCDYKEYACVCVHGGDAHDHGDDHDHGASVDPPDDVPSALELVRDAMKKVQSASGMEAVDEAAAYAEAAIAAAAGFLQTQKAPTSANQKRLEGALDNLKSGSHRLHDAAHDGDQEEVDKALKQLEGVVDMVTRYIQ
ncbi:MAG: hypothetical protein ACI8UO_003915 [Verrucomicrobiales bacterium]|jgi:hypothetical protein